MLSARHHERLIDACIINFIIHMNNEERIPAFYYVNR